MSSLFQGGHLLSILIFFPAVGALALLLLRGDDHIWIRRIALIVSVAEFLFSLLLLRGIAVNVRRLSVRGICAMDRLAADSLSPGRGRHQPVPGSADHFPDADFDAGFVEQHQSPRKGLLRDAADAGSRRDRRVSCRWICFCSSCSGK